MLVPNVRARYNEYSMVTSIFIAQPNVSFDILLKACADTLDHKVTESIDNTLKQLSDSEKYLSILAAIRDANASVNLTPNLLTHITFSVLTVATDVDMMDVLEACSGMAFTHAETKMRGGLIAVITGTMQQWRDAIITGSQHSQGIIRGGFDQLHDLFIQAGLGTVWNDYESQTQSDGTYKLIEHKR